MKAYWQPAGFIQLSESKMREFLAPLHVKLAALLATQKVIDD